MGGNKRVNITVSGQHQKESNMPRGRGGVKRRNSLVGFRYPMTRTYPEGRFSMNVQALPDEVLLKIMKNLSGKEQLRLGLVNHRFNSLAYDRTLWKDHHQINMETNVYSRQSHLQLHSLNLMAPGEAELLGLQKVPLMIAKGKETMLESVAYSVQTRSLLRWLVEMRIPKELCLSIKEDYFYMQLYHSLPSQQISVTSLTLHLEIRSPFEENSLRRLWERIDPKTITSLQIMVYYLQQHPEVKDFPVEWIKGCKDLVTFWFRISSAQHNIYDSLFESNLETATDYASAQRQPELVAILADLPKLNTIRFREQVGVANTKKEAPITRVCLKFNEPRPPLWAT